MKRLPILTITTAFLVGLGTMGPAFASEAPDPFAYISPESPGFGEYASLIERLDSEGAEILLIEKTFLGRLRIVSVLNGRVREIVISPNTGEIRRDIILGKYQADDFRGRGKSAGNGVSASKGHANANPGSSGAGRGGGGGGGGGKGR